MNMKYVYLGVSLCSSLCIMTDYYIIPCTNMVGVMCLVDFYFIKKNDMRLHHILVLCMLHYMNNHSDIKSRKEIVSQLLRAEISTIFLIMNNLLENTGNIILKNINRAVFVCSFIYFRVYNYSYLILDKNMNNEFLNYSKNNVEYCQIYIGLYGLFILNLYWSYVIFKTSYQNWRKCIKDSDKTKNM